MDLRDWQAASGREGDVLGDRELLVEDLGIGCKHRLSPDSLSKAILSNREEREERQDHKPIEALRVLGVLGG
jgi:hypothetical protein